ncbi:MAG: ComF family protein [Oscillospiraceae bacterium]|nr:ComF family protein [Oscillospiraceae bacterium]
MNKNNAIFYKLFTLGLAASRRIIGLFFPPRCPICGKLSYDESTPCPECSVAVHPIEPPLCPYCGREEGRCWCISDEHAYESVLCPFHYLGSVKKGIYRLKYQASPCSETYFARHMALKICDVYSGISFDIITCVPMHPSSLKERGYNPAKRLAELLSRQLQIPYRDCLKKVGEGEKQHSLSSSARAKNVKGLFAVNKKLKLQGKTILLCDDVFTTGATFNECAKILLEAGAKGVYCTAAAATPKNVE